MPAKAKCSHDDSRLTCVDCSAVICSACLVQCPVGFRCPSCAGASAKGTPGAKGAKSTPNALIVARALAVCVGAGYGFGVLMPFIDLPFVGVFICLAAGLMVGRVCAPIVDDRRIGNGVTVTIVFGILIGMSLTGVATMLNLVLAGVINAITSQPDRIIAYLGAFVSALFNPVAFLMGFLRMTIWRW